MASNDQAVPDFRRFLDSVASATHDNYRATAGGGVANTETFEEMRRHVLGLYEGVEALHSFVDDGGQVFDCIPIEQQPSLRGSGEKIAEAPTLIFSSTEAGTGEVPVGSQVNLERKDRYGNVLLCPPGTIPMRRITLEELSRFESLRHFFRKAPLLLGEHAVSEVTTPKPGEHCYARAFQNPVANFGGHSLLNLWRRL